MWLYSELRLTYVLLFWLIYSWWFCLSELVKVLILSHECSVYSSLWIYSGIASFVYIGSCQCRHYVLCISFTCSALESSIFLFKFHLFAQCVDNWILNAVLLNNANLDRLQSGAIADHHIYHIQIHYFGLPIS